ncbi:hypothetical protein AAC387_Pa03g0380 [Persea americana]
MVFYSSSKDYQKIRAPWDVLIRDGTHPLNGKKTPTPDKDSMNVICHLRPGVYATLSPSTGWFGPDHYCGLLVSMEIWF